jgi:hypothetical protein
MRYLLATTALAALALAAPVSADAATVLKFFSGGSGYTGAFSGSNTVYNSIVTIPVTQTCANNAVCGSLANDPISASQTYGAGTSGLTATANGLNVWDDISPNFGGLGVGTGETTGTDTNDNIDGSNLLTLTFNTRVTLTGIATLFDSAHGDFGGGNPLTGSFLLGVDGGAAVSTSFASANLALLSLTGTVFTFAENGTGNPTFYVSGVSFNSGQSLTPTPLPGALAMFGGGLLGLGALLRRKRTNRLAA